MANRFLSAIKSATQAKGKVPGNAKILALAAKHPRDFAKTVKASAEAGLAYGRLKTGSRNNWELAKVGRNKVAKEIYKSEKIKDLAVNSGGLAGSIVGGSTGGVPGALIGDNLGAVGTRKAINRQYAKSRAKQKLGSNASKAEVKARTQKTVKAIERLDKRKKTLLGDQAGWAIGNGVAMATPGVKLPLRGGIAAMRSVPQIQKNVKRAQRGEITKKQAVVETIKEIAKDNNPRAITRNIRKKIRRGRARERLMKSKANKYVDYLDYFSRNSSRTVLFSGNFTLVNPSTRILFAKNYL